MAGSPEIDPVPQVADHLSDEKTEKTDKPNDNYQLHIERVESGVMSGKNNPDYDRVDSEVAKYAATSKVVIDEATNTRLKKLINRRVLYVMIFTYFLQALDKGTLSFASVMGIQEDTHLEGQEVCLTIPHKYDTLTFKQYSWLTTCIYIAILFVEYPTNWIISRVPIAKYLGCNIILWGAVLMCHAASKDFTSLVVVRTLLGIFEACCQPIFILMSSMWFLREEQTATVSYW